MEFNVNATDVGAALRTGIGEHTLSIGDRDVTLMVNGSRVGLQRFALDVAAQAGLKLSVGGFVEGAEAYKALSNDHKALTAEAQRLIGKVRRVQAKPDANQLARDIERKANALIPDGARHICGPEIKYWGGDGPQAWKATIAVKPSGARNRVVSAYGNTIEAALVELDRKVGEL